VREAISGIMMTWVIGSPIEIIVIQRKTRNCFRCIRGAEASDTFLSLMATCRKQGMVFWDYFNDRVYNLHKIPPLTGITKNGQLLERF